MPIKKLQEEVENTLQMILSGVYMCAYLRGDLKQEVDMKVIFKSIKRINKFLDKAYKLGRKEEREECIRYMRSGNISGSFSTGCDCEDCNKYEKKVRKDLSDHSEGKK